MILPLKTPPAPPGFPLLLLILGLLTGCEGPGNPGGSALQPGWFSDGTGVSKINFRHFNGMTGERYFCETVGPGIALFDYDGDGDLDLFVVQGKLLGEEATIEQSVFPPIPGTPPFGRLLRNNGSDSSGQVTFSDVTDGSEIIAAGYGMGCAVGDIDADGDPDLLLTAFGRDQMWRNDGDGTFTDVSESSGIDDSRWTTSAAFFDYDEDGDLDLFVCAYVDFTLENHKPCYSETSALDYCGPSSYRPETDRLYRNRGDGTFEDVTSSSGIGTAYGAALGVIVSDFDGDQRVDIYVANDGYANQLWLNQGDGTFRDEALLAGCAFNRDGKAEASMGADAADIDGDGDEDIFLSHLTDETNTLYVNQGNGVFDDRSSSSGLGVPSLIYTGFGAAWIDIDNDGALDLLIANGAVKTIEAQASAGELYPLHQPNQVFINRGDGHFDERSSAAGPALAISEVSRGAAFGDIDNDGDTDVLIGNNSGALRLLVNEVGSEKSWVGLHLRDDRGLETPGAIVRVERADGSTIWRRVRIAASYLSANDPRVLVGLGDSTGPIDIEVRWRGGEREWFGPLGARRYHSIDKGKGRKKRE